MNVALPPRLVRDKPRRELRLRCPLHRQFVRQHACCVQDQDCNGEIQAAHIRIGTNGGMSLKPDDSQIISLCEWHHEWQHQFGEQSFEARYNIDMKALAQAFWTAFRKHNPSAARRAEAKVFR